MEREEFETAWAAAMAKLDAEEQQMVEQVISGAEVNYSVIYMAVAFVLGVLAGIAGMGVANG